MKAFWTILGLIALGFAGYFFWHAFEVSPEWVQLGVKGYTALFLMGGFFAAAK